MEIKYNVKGAERKRLVKAVEEFYGVKAKYLGAPSFAYKLEYGNDFFKVDYPTIDKEGAIITPDDEVPDGLIKALERAGFKAADGPTEGAKDADPDENTDELEKRESAALRISLPGDFLTDDQYANLEKLVKQKRTLLLRAAGFIGLERNEEITFEFESSVNAPTYSKLASKMAMMAKTQTRFSDKEKPIVNEKYEFRCFLLRLGFIGDEWKADRKILLQNLSGSAAFKRKDAK